MSKGFLWFCQNNKNTDYVKLSILLAESLKKHNKENKICVVTDEASKFTNKNVDFVKILKKDDSAEHEIKWANEYKAFELTPFKHTIKLEADMLWNQNTDWWWYHLWQNDLVFSVDCKNYRDNIIKDTFYRQLFIRNRLPNIYNGLMYFRKSKKAQKFFQLCEVIYKNWDTVKNDLLVACHDTYPSTDVVFALAYRIIDPTQTHLVDYNWFKFIHNKSHIHGLGHIKLSNQYLYPNKVKDQIYFGEEKLSSVLHYFEKQLPEEIDARIF